MDRRIINNWCALVACTRWGALSKIACLGSIGLARPSSCLHQRFTPKSARHLQRCRFSRKSQLRTCLSLRPGSPRVFELRIDSINGSMTPSVSHGESIHRAALAKQCARGSALGPPDVRLPLVGVVHRARSHRFLPPSPAIVTGSIPVSTGGSVSVSAKAQWYIFGRKRLWKWHRYAIECHIWGV